ncbi:DUF1016 N-terminal domain-containing protein [Limnobaculum parvum]|uniref:DUF1016 N-terminal domain-containing protein n=1 Tax=Limnobaculum parvum TaxID=2172103 RepID=UPI002E75CC00|nr:DUF1016 N-terminal domain-containing protein [Limnobaculum parvum]
MKQLAKGLRTAFPELKGFSRANLMSMRAFAEAWPDMAIVLFTRLKDTELRMAYARQALEYGWSRNRD